MLQHVAKGRLDLMVGRGNTVPVYPWFGKDIRQGVALALENYNLLHRLWREDVVDWEGSFRTPCRASRRRRARSTTCRRSCGTARSARPRSPSRPPTTATATSRTTCSRPTSTSSRSSTSTATVRTLRSRPPRPGDRRPRRSGVHREAVAGRRRRIPAVLRGVPALPGSSLEDSWQRTPLSGRQPAGGHRQDPHVPGGVRRLPAPAVLVDGRHCPSRWRSSRSSSLGTEVVPVLRKEMAARRPGVADAPTHSSLVSAKYGDADARQPRPNSNRGATSRAPPYQDSDPAALRDPRWRRDGVQTRDWRTRPGRRCTEPRPRSHGSSPRDMGRPSDAGVHRAVRARLRADGLRSPNSATRCSSRAGMLSPHRASRVPRPRPTARRCRRRAGRHIRLTLDGL